MKILQFPSPTAEKRLQRITQRGLGFKSKDAAAVRRILEAVRKNGDQAVLEYARRFDAPKLALNRIKVTDAEMAAAGSSVDRRFKRVLNRAAGQIAAFHQKQVTRSWMDTARAGTLLGQMVHPVDAAGVYVPGAQGGTTPLVSSVLMGAIPAKIAGVPRIAMVTPSTPDGKVNPFLLVAAQKAGVDEVYKIGSAWAIAALAYGTETIAKVDVIVGPGNIYVTLAKKLVSGMVRIDMIAGPSEVLVVADDSADPRFVAADMLSQAEHDPLAAAMLVTDSMTLARAVDKALAGQLADLERRDIAQKAIDAFGALLVVPDVEAAIELANRIAPEHLELHLREPFAHLGQIRHAGAVFIGPYTPEPVGDYMAGPNHVLPTAGTARFSSALSVACFQKTTSILHYSREAFRSEAADIAYLARIEGLDAHARSVEIRQSPRKK